MSIQSDVEGRGQRPTADSESFEAVIIGGGQAGLSVGYHLAKRDRPFVILEANQRIGDSWRKRWDSLRLFTPAQANSPIQRKFSKRLLTSKIQLFTLSTYIVN